MTVISHIIAFSLVLVIGFIVFYCYFLVFIYLFYPARSPGADVEPSTRFAIVIPAHNEEASIGKTLESVKSLDYPEGLFQTVVVADNCTDKTASISTAEGVKCLERADEVNRGKGYALEFGIRELRGSDFNAFIILDADCEISPNFLKAADTRIQMGQQVIQSGNGVSNPDSNPMAYILHVGNMMENRLLYEARSRIGLNALLRGTGMCFSREVLLAHPFMVHSITEDTGYSLELINGDIHIDYAPEASVMSPAPTTLKQTTDQRIRWASGNLGPSRTHFASLMAKGILKRDSGVFDAGLTLMISSKPVVILSILIALAIQTVLMLASNGTSLMPLILTSIFLLAYAVYILMGAFLERITPKRLMYLFISPLYVGLLTMITILGMTGFRQKMWTRTGRS